MAQYFFIYLDNNMIGDEGVEYFQHFKALERLNICANNLSEAGAEALTKF